jgi:hypothetical protein
VKPVDIKPVKSIHSPLELALISFFTDKPVKNATRFCLVPRGGVTYCIHENRGRYIDKYNYLTVSQFSQEDAQKYSENHHGCLVAYFLYLIFHNIFC